MTGTGTGAAQRLRRISELPDALHEPARFGAALAGRRPAVFLDYDGTLTPIVDRPQDAVLSEAMRTVVRDLAGRCPVCVVSGRDRPEVAGLLGIDGLVIAGSHGFDIGGPDGGSTHQAAEGYDDLLAAVADRMRAELGAVRGVLIEPKRASVAVHYRLAAPAHRPAVAAAVQRTLAAHPDRLKVTPGKLVYEIQPRLDWDKGRAVRHLVSTLALDRPDTTSLYLGDDLTDEDAFGALAGRGIGIVVAGPDEPDRPTAAAFRLRSTEEVARFLDALAR